jgi:hypothetical protein
MQRLFHSLAALRHIAIGGSLTGLGTGVFWSLVVSLFSIDQLFNGTELLLSLAAPGIIAVTIWKTLKIRFWIVMSIAYSTLLIPLFGIAFGGANTLQMTIGGVIGGFCWSAPIILYYFGHGVLRGQTAESLRSAGTTRATPDDSS